MTRPIPARTLERRAAACVLLLAALAVASPMRSAPILSELLYDASGADDGRVFVEITGDPGEALSGLVVEGVNGADGAVTVSIALSGAVPDDGVFVLADLDAQGTTAVAEADLLADFDFQNGPDGGGAAGCR